MITPVELQSKTFKSGIGYDKKDVDRYIEELLVDYEVLYKSKLELNEGIVDLKEKLQYYESIEKTLQKALILAEKTAESTKQAAREEADLIIKEAKIDANALVREAKNELINLQRQTIDLIQQYELYKTQITQLAKTQYDLINSDSFKLQGKTYMDMQEVVGETLTESNQNEETIKTKETETNNKEENINEKNFKFFDLDDDK